MLHGLIRTYPMHWHFPPTELTNIESPFGLFATLVYENYLIGYREFKRNVIHFNDVYIWVKKRFNGKSITY